MQEDDIYHAVAIGSAELIRLSSSSKQDYSCVQVTSQAKDPLTVYVSVPPPVVESPHNNSSVATRIQSIVLSGGANFNLLYLETNKPVSALLDNNESCIFEFPRNIEHVYVGAFFMENELNPCATLVYFERISMETLAKISLDRQRICQFPPVR